MRDLTVNGKIKSEDYGLTEQRDTQLMKQGDKVHVEDITSGKVQIIDSLEKVY